MTMAAAATAPTDESRRSLFDALAARFRNRFSTGMALREQHANTLTWIACQPPDAVVFAETTAEVAEIVRRQYDPSLYDYRTPRGVGLKNGWDFLAPQVVAARAGACTWPYTPNGCARYSNRSGWEVAYAYWRDPAYLGPLQLHRPYQWSNWADPGYSTLLYARP